MRAIAIDEFESPFFLNHEDLELPVYRSRQGSVPLIVLHELPGMTGSFIQCCGRFAHEGYRVYMPLIFKTPYTEMTGLAMPLFCLSAEFRRLFASTNGPSGSRPFTRWLLALTETVAQRHPDQPFGVVGMCLTGGFALATIAQPGVSAAIACQPSYPIWSGIATIGLSDEERDAAVARSATLAKPCAKGYRFRGDWICRNAHMTAIESCFQDAFERYPDLDGSAHSTLTTSTASAAVLDDVLQFLGARLAIGPDA